MSSAVPSLFSGCCGSMHGRSPHDNHSGPPLALRSHGKSQQHPLKMRRGLKNADAYFTTETAVAVADGVSAVEHEGVDRWVVGFHSAGVLLYLYAARAPSSSIGDVAPVLVRSRCVRTIHAPSSGIRVEGQDERAEYAARVDRWQEAYSSAQLGDIGIAS